MKKNLVVILLVINVVLAFTPVVASAETLAKPTVTLPPDWELVYETPYPDSLSEHDPLGAGLLEYQNLKNQDGVMIYYEKAPTTVYTDAMLKAEAEEIFRLDHFGGGFNVSGVITVAGVKAGYAEVYVADYDIYDIVLVFIKDNYYINAYAAYNANSASENSVMALLNSIGVNASPTPTTTSEQSPSPTSTATPTPTSTPLPTSTISPGSTSGNVADDIWLFLIVGIIITVIILVVSIVAFKKYK